MRDLTNAVSPLRPWSGKLDSTIPRGGSLARWPGRLLATGKSSIRDTHYSSVGRARADQNIPRRTTLAQDSGATR